jgi:osmotically-inducible protein OsmY
MFRRLFALLLLAALAAAGVYYWQSRATGRPAGDLSEVGDRLKDAALTGAVKAALELHRGLAPLDVRVTTEDGVVTLRGDVPDESLRDEAVRVASAVPKVRQVVTQMRVAGSAPAREPGGRSLGESLDDRTLEAKVRLAFSLNRDLEGAAIRVEVYRRGARLSGYVESTAQKDLATRIAGEVPGVESVSEALRVGGKAPAEAPARVGRREAVASALRGNANLARYVIEVTEEGRAIVLRGRVRTGAERDLAGLLAREAAGEAVDNRLMVGDGSG